MSTKTSNLHIIALHEMYFLVVNVETATDWYVRNFGVTLVDRQAKRTTLRLAEGSLLTLVESDQRNKFDSPPINFKAHDAMRAHELLNKAEVRAQEPERFYHYVDFDVWDPDGNSFNVISDPAWPSTPNNFFRIDGIFLGVINFEQMLAWYADVLGAKLEYAFTGPTSTLAEARFRCFRDIPFNLVESPESVMQHRVCEFQTTDAQADYKFLQAKGVRVTELIEQDGKRTFAFFDPEGRELGMVELLA